MLAVNEINIAALVFGLADDMTSALAKAAKGCKHMDRLAAIFLGYYAPFVALEALIYSKTL